MLAVALVLFAAVALTAYLASYEPTRTAHLERARSDVVATNFLLYRTAVIRYVTTHPGSTGPVADGNLTWDSGYTKSPEWAAAITSGQLYVYSTAPQPMGVTESLYRMSGNSLLVGYKSGSFLYNIHGGGVGVPLPGYIPAGGMVAVGGA